MVDVRCTPRRDYTGSAARRSATTRFLFSTDHTTMFHPRPVAHTPCFSVTLFAR